MRWHKTYRFSFSPMFRPATVCAYLYRIFAGFRCAWKRRPSRTSAFYTSGHSSRCVLSSCSRPSRLSTHSKRSSPSFLAWLQSRWWPSSSISSPACMSAPAYTGESRSTPTTRQTCNSSSRPEMWTQRQAAFLPRPHVHLGFLSLISEEQGTRISYFLISLASCAI